MKNEIIELAKILRMSYQASMLTKKQFAKEIGTSEETVMRIMKEGNIKYRRIGSGNGSPRFSIFDVAEFITAHNIQQSIQG